MIYSHAILSDNLLQNLNWGWFNKYNFFSPICQLSSSFNTGKKWKWFCASLMTNIHIIPFQQVTYPRAKCQLQPIAITFYRKSIAVKEQHTQEPGRHHQRIVTHISLTFIEVLEYKQAATPWWLCKMEIIKITIPFNRAKSLVLTWNRLDIFQYRLLTSAQDTRWNRKQSYKFPSALFKVAIWDGLSIHRTEIF